MWKFSKNFILIASCITLLLGIAVLYILPKNSVHAESVKHSYTMKLLQVRYYPEIDRIIVRGVTNLPQATTIKIKLKDKDSLNFLEKDIYVQNGTFFAMLNGTENNYNNNFIKSGDYDVLGNVNDKNIVMNTILGEIFIPNAH